MIRIHRLIEHYTVTSMTILYSLAKQNLGYLKKTVKDLIDVDAKEMDVF